MTNDASPGGTDNGDHDGARRDVQPIPPGPLSGQQHPAGSQERPGPVPVFGAPDPHAPPPGPRTSPSMPPAAPGPSASASGQQGSYPTSPGQPGSYPMGGGQQGSYPMGPGQQNSYPTGPGQPGFYPMGPPPRKGGLPVWGWVLIGVGVVVVGFVGLIVTLFFLGLAAGVSDTTTSSGSDPVPAPTDISIPEFTDDAGTGFDDPAAGSAIDVPQLQPLDVPTTFTTTPSWGVPPDPWTLDESPVEGIFFFSNANGCDMELEQSIIEPVEGFDDLTSDATASQSYLTLLREYFAELEGGTAEGTPGSVPVSINFAGGPTMDLATSTLPGLTLDGQTGVRLIATRAMPVNSGAVSTIITCPQSVLDADPAYFEQAVAQLYILPTP